MNYLGRQTGGSAIYVPASEMLHQSEADGGSEPAVTGYDYTWHEGTLQMSQRTTIWPVTTAEQNGSGQPDARTEVYDTYGQATWVRDERGSSPLTFTMWQRARWCGASWTRRRPGWPERGRAGIPRRGQTQPDE